MEAGMEQRKQGRDIELARRVLSAHALLTATGRIRVNSRHSCKSLIPHERIKNKKLPNEPICHIRITLFINNLIKPRHSNTAKRTRSFEMPEPDGLNQLKTESQTVRRLAPSCPVAHNRAIKNDTFIHDAATAFRRGI